MPARLPCSTARRNIPRFFNFGCGALRQLPDNEAREEVTSRMPTSPTSSLTRASLSLNKDLMLTVRPWNTTALLTRLADANIDLAKAKEWGDKALDGLYHESLDTTIEDVALRDTTNMGPDLGHRRLGVLSRWRDFAKAEAYLRLGHACPVAGSGRRRPSGTGLPKAGQEGTSRAHLQTRLCTGKTASKGPRSKSAISS